MGFVLIYANTTFQFGILACYKASPKLFLALVFILFFLTILCFILFFFENLLHEIAEIIIGFHKELSFLKAQEVSFKFRTTQVKPYRSGNGFILLAM